MCVVGVLVVFISTFKMYSGNMALCAMLTLLVMEGKCDFGHESMINKFLDTLPKLVGTMLLALR